MLKIGFASVEDPSSPNAFSGSTFRLIQALRAQGAEIVPLGPLSYQPGLADRLYGQLLKKAGRNYWPDYSAAAYRTYARTLNERLQGQSLDCILARSTPPISAFSSPVPLAVWNDATFVQVLGQYRGFDGLSRFERKSRDKAERHALQAANRVIFTSKWAIDSAVRDYGVAPERTAVIPIGANRDANLSSAQIAELQTARDFSVCRLLFIGVDWQRKGGDRFLALVKALNARNIPVQGDMVGAWPPAYQVIPNCVRCHGMLPHSEAASAAVFGDLFRQAHFLILPSRVDCTPVVVAEAFSQGIPVVTSTVGGLPEMVRGGATGFAADFDADSNQAVEASAKWIAESFQNPAAWRKCSQAAYETQKAEMSWEAHARHLLSVLGDMTAGSKS